MAASKPKVRLRWRRLATIVIGAYLLYWSGVSLHHMIVIAQDQHALSQKIAAIRAKNHVLTLDLRLLNNPAKLKGMLTGKIPYPNPANP